MKTRFSAAAATVGLAGALIFSTVPLESGAQFAMPTRTYEQVPFINGGIGVDEADFMRSAAKDYSLRLTFAGKKSEFLADVSVVITDSRGVAVFKMGGMGPLLYLTLAPGKYQVSAVFNGVTQTRGVTIPEKGGIDLSFVWNAPSSEPAAPMETPASSTY